MAALFPLYSDRVAPYFWSFNPNVQEETSETESTIHGVVKEVDPDNLYAIADGRKIAVRGYWTAEANGAKHENVWAGDVISQYIKPA